MSDGEEKRKSCGIVYLVGAGPGDPDLLTLRALRLLSNADVVVYDRLISRDILDLVPAGVSRLSVGKSSGCHNTPQDQINSMLVNLARTGRNVVRLKGGDPFVFGRGSEEALHLSQAGIAYEVIPGVTAAVACTAYAGIPLTHRGISQGFRVVTGHLRENGVLSLDWRALADPESTLVVYMGLETVEELCRKLMQAGLSGSTPAAAIENGTTREQRVVCGELQTLPELLKTSNLKPPTLVVIGKTVALQSELAWIRSLKNEQDDHESLSAWAGS